MHHFTYKSGTLCAEDVPLQAIADKIGTPFYCYSTATITRHVRVLQQAFEGSDPLICYAVKANSNQAVLATMKRLGLGMDVVSEGELRRARAAGVAADKIIFAGVGKTRSEMAYAISEDILGFNVESAAELHALSSVASEVGRPARISIRVNPDVDARTHAKISTGKSENKFGVPFTDALQLYRVAADLPGIVVTGVHMHIGSQIRDLTPFAAAFRLMRDLAIDLKRAGHRLTHLDLGGGLGVPDRPDHPVPPSPAEYAQVVREALGDLELKFVVEPGRMIVANAGVLVTEVLYTKGDRKSFTIVDAAMNDLIRPTLYDAYHDIWPLDEIVRDRPPQVQDIVGPVCESGDYFTQGRMLPTFQAGDRLALMTAGAYGAVMASTYNTRLLIPEVLVDGGKYAVVRPRPSFEELIGLDKLPPWLG